MLLKNILNLSRYALSRMGESALSGIHKTIKNAFKQREKTFVKNNAEKAIPKSLQEMKKGNLTKRDLINQIGEMSNFMSGETGTYARYHKKQLEKMEKLGERLGIEFESEEEYDEYGRFMGAMQERLGEVWKDKASGEGEKLFVEAKRLNLNPMQFVRNYEYWMEHLDDLEEARPLHAKNLKPSSYIRQLGLERIKDFKSRK